MTVTMCREGGLSIKRVKKNPKPSAEALFHTNPVQTATIMGV